MMEYAVWASAIAKASGMVNTSLISLTCSKDLERKDCGSKGCEKRWQWECDGHDRYYLEHGTHGMLDAIVTFQKWRRFGTDTPPIDNLFSRFLTQRSSFMSG